MSNIKIAVAGTGYVGLSIATLLAQHNEVVAVDIIPEKVEKINKGISPIVDKEIEEVRNQQLIVVNASVATEGDKETFYITKDNVDGTKEVVYRLKCGENDAFTVFGFVASEQQKEFRKSNFTIKWRVIRMFNSETGLQVCQES